MSGDIAMEARRFADDQLHVFQRHLRERLAIARYLKL